MYKLKTLLTEDQQKNDYAPSDFMSCAQSDFVNVEDSISQIDFSG